MSLSLFGVGSAAPFAAATGATVNTPIGLQQGDLLVVVFGFEQVGSGSGPWVSGTPQAGWSRGMFQDPSATGSGLEVWVANWDTGIFTNFNFNGTYDGIAREAAYRCGNALPPTFSDPQTQQQSGDNPAAPSTTTIHDGDEVLICAAYQLTAPGFGTVAPYAQAFDNTRAGFGTVEITLHNAPQAIKGASGGATWTATASPAGHDGATGAFGSSCFEPQSHLLPILGVGS